MYLTGRLLSDCCICRVSLRWLAALCRPGKRRARARGPPACRRRSFRDRRFDRLDADAVFERAQLFERFGALHRGLRQRRQAQQAVARGRRTGRCAPRPAPRGWPGRVNGIGAREKYSANPSRSTTTLVTFGFCDARPDPSMRAAQRAHLELRVGGERRHRRVDRRGREERLVSLDVDDQIARRDARRSPRGDRCRSGATRDVIRDVAAEGQHRVGDAPIVGRHDHRRRWTPPRRRAGRRARSSAGRRSRPAPCPGDGSTGIARG